MQLLGTIGLIIFAIVVCKLPSWKSGRRSTPPGYHIDWKQSSIDAATKGKDYYFRQHLAGKYDIKDEK